MEIVATKRLDRKNSLIFTPISIIALISNIFGSVVCVLVRTYIHPKAYTQLRGYRQ